MRNTIIAIAMASVCSLATAGYNDQAALALAKPQEFIADKSLSPEATAAMLAPAKAFYGFWNNASQQLLDRAIAPDFVDHTPPPGRQQGPQGPMLAAKAFLAAIPDLKVTVVQQLLVGDRVVSHLRMTGHFTGMFKGRQGEGQKIDIIATDILRVRGGRITDNWHLEDNLAFMTQIGLVQ